MKESKEYIPITSLRNGTVLKFGPGKIDKYCIHVCKPGRKTEYPKDVDYFLELKALTREFDKYKVYGDFVQIYTVTSGEVDKKVLHLIDKIADTYKNPDAVQQTFTIIYAAMIAEENREGTMLGRRIKRLGVRQVLIENYSPTDAALFSRGMPWDEIDAECRRRGF